ncbi:NUMOD4 domain-containing protein [Jeotgalibaca porci]|uniref:NUMOD4 domain-containing protein n=1 Tax=Jeotgalibaca porci TaxID=1868793 RepID=UPI0035A06B82
MKEKWMPIKNYEGFYEVSNLGRVRSVDRVVRYKDGRMYKYPSKLIKHKADKRGYLYVGLNKSGKKSSKRVHRLVTETFLPVRGKNLEVNHIDGNKNNNKLSNLEWVTSSENTLKGYELGLFEKARKSARLRVKNNSEFDRSKSTKVTNIITGEEWVFPSVKEASESFGYKKNTFSEAMRVRNGICGRGKELIVELINGDG